MAARARTYETAILLGSPGTGKTTLAEALIARWRAERSAHGGAGEVLVLDPARQFRETPGVIASWPGERDPEDQRSPEERAAAWLVAIKRQIARESDQGPPRLIVIDDCDTYLTAGSPRGVWRDFLMTFRHWRCDVLATARRTQEVPKVLAMNASRAYLFATREPNAREYVARWLGSPVARAIPDKAHTYLLVDCVTRQTAIKRTARRQVKVAADL